MQKQWKLSWIAAALVTAGAAHATDYVSVGDTPLRTAFGECVHTGYWTPGSADCDAKQVAAVGAQPQAEVAPLKVFFGFDQAELDADGRKALDGLAEKLRARGVERVVAVGHADALGPDKYNQRLSELRVRAVRDYLLEKGLPLHAFRLEAKGKRDSETMGTCGRIGEPRDAAQLIACLGPDRRVEIEVLAMQTSAASGGGQPAK